MTTALELFGVACLAVFAFFLWPPAALAVVGACSLLAAYAIERGRK